MCSLWESEILDANIGRIVLALYVDNGEDFDIDDVIRHLRVNEYVPPLTDEAVSLIPGMIHEWKSHFERKKLNYLQKNKNISWFNDKSYEIFDK